MNGRYGMYWQFLQAQNETHFTEKLKEQHVNTLGTFHCFSQITDKKRKTQSEVSKPDTEVLMICAQTTIILPCCSRKCH